MDTAAKNTFLNKKGFSPIVVMGTTYTERVEAGKAILGVCKRMTNPAEKALGVNSLEAWIYRVENGNASP